MKKLTPPPSPAQPSAAAPAGTRTGLLVMLCLMLFLTFGALTAIVIYLWVHYK